MILATRSRRAVPLRWKSSADSVVFRVFRCNSETRVPLVDGRRTKALLVSIALQVGFFLESLPLSAAALAMSVNVKFPWGAILVWGVGGDGALERGPLGFLLSFNGGGGPTLHTVVNAIAISKGRWGRADIVAVVTAATCFVKRGSSCQNGCEDGSVLWFLVSVTGICACAPWLSRLELRLR